MNAPLTNDNLQNYYKKIKYIVLFPDTKIKGYMSLRNISQEIFIDYSTISKKLSETNPCTCSSNFNNNTYLIHKIKTH